MAGKWEKVKGEKHIYRNTENSKKYKVDLYYGRDERGKMIRSSKVIEGTLTEARKLLALHEADRVKQIAQKPTKATLKMVFDNWNAMVGDVRNEETTQTSTRNLQRHMLEYFGDIRIDKLTTTLIRKYLAYLKSEKGLKAKTVNKHRTHLHTIFDYMMSEESVYGVYRNPVDLIKPYPVEEFDHQIYSPEEAKDLLIALHQSERHDLEIAVNLAFWCAFRREEVCALEWSSVDLEERIIRVCEVRTTAKGRVIERMSTKNKENRSVGIPEWLYRCLNELRGRQDSMRDLLQGNYYQNKDYVFCHDDGKPWHPNSLSKEYKNFLEKNGFRHIRFHDLRHPYVKPTTKKFITFLRISGQPYSCP